MTLNTVVKIYIGVVLSLIIVGMLLVFSSSGYFSMRYNSMYLFFNSHFNKVLLSLAAIFIFSKIPYSNYRNNSKLIIIGMLLLLVATLIFAPKVKGAARWINLGVIQFQPSELAKLILVIHLSNLIVNKGERIKDFQNGLVYALFWIFLTAGLVFVQPNVSLSLIIVIASFILLYVGGANFKHIFAISLPVFLVGGTFAMLFSHSRHRIMTYVGSIINGTAINHQVQQAKIALGSGGFLGVGLGMSRQSDGFVPEAYGDFIFSILGEELGFVGTFLILAAYLILFYLGLKIAKSIDDKFGQLLVFGLSLMIVLGGFFNAAVVIGLAPTTGITLPFISYGGTSLLIFCASVGIIINVAMQSIKKSNIGVLED